MPGRGLPPPLPAPPPAGGNWHAPPAQGRWLRGQSRSKLQAISRHTGMPRNPARQVRPAGQSAELKQIALALSAHRIEKKNGRLRTCSSRAIPRMASPPNFSCQHIMSDDFHTASAREHNKITVIIRPHLTPTPASRAFCFLNSCLIQDFVMREDGQ